jgi:DNA primase
VNSGLDFDFKERVREATDIVDLIGSYLTLRRVGSKYKGLCPWHADSKPSLDVNPARGTWMCWPCHDGGDVFSFTMKKEGVDFAEALRILADRAGLEMPRHQRAKPAAPGTEKTTLYKTLAWAAEQFHQFLNHDPQAEDARIYLDQRAVSSQSIETFQIGFCPPARNWLIDKAREDNIALESMLACGLVGKWTESNRYYDLFQGRVMFPIQDTENRVVAFGGRILPQIADQIQQEQNRTVGKYFNTPETKLFTKSNLLYGLNLVREEVGKSRTLVVVEGYTDVVMAYQFGLRNTVAALGTAINERHIRLMKRFADKIILVLDGDEAGQRRTNEILELFVAADVDLRIAVLPERFDPCDFLIEHDTPAFESFIADSRDALDHKFTIETRGIDLINDTHQANEALDRILQTLSKRPASNSVGNSLLREQQMLARLARKFALPESNLRLRLKQLRRSPSAAPRRQSTEENTEVSRINLSELDSKEIEFFEILLLDCHIVEQAIGCVPATQIASPALRELYELICEMHASGTDVDFHSVLLSVDRPDYKTLLVELDQRATEKHSASTHTVQERLQTVVSAFDAQLNHMTRRRMLSQLESGNISDDQELAALNEILQQNRIQKMKGHDCSAPMDG